ncbi:MAG TPA: DUF4382 domain-containing protein [Steroidobacteraceae bacterium]|nr:DUF4382 domain-containing protein [Steroidobacteraceae bacterium]
MISDASSDDWAVIGVKVLSIALQPQGGGSAVTVWTAPNPAPYVNLEQLDQLGEILGNVSVADGTYTGAVLTIAANPGDVLLTVAADPESGFPVAGGTTIASGLIQIQGKQGTSGSFTVPIKVTFDTPLTVSAAHSNALDLEFDLAHPAFIVGHTPPVAAGQTLWAMNFEGPVRHHPVSDITRLVLRHTYGTVKTVDSTDAFFTIVKDFPVLPVANPETAVASAISLDIYADATNGTIFYDLDAKTTTVVKSFSAEATSLPGKFVRVAARYQVDGKLAAVRVWASSDFDKVWLSPEGHVLHVNTTTDVITVSNEAGQAVPLTIDANTQFFFRAPENALSGATPIGTGPGFLASHNLVRGFKVHVNAVDPLASPMVADTVDIETAGYSGRISSPGNTNFTYTHNFATATDDYSVTLDYISGTTANTDPSGNSVMGFLWWDFTFPTLATTGSNAVAQFVLATNGSVNFGGSVGSIAAWGVSGATWGDPASPNGWSLRNAVLLPTPVPLGLVSTAYSSSSDSFAMTVLGGTQPATIDVSIAMQSATLVYQIDRSNGVITITPVDVSTASGQAALAAGLAAGTPVKVYGLPQPDGTLKAYVLAYFTGTLPAA